MQMHNRMVRLSKGRPPAPNCLRCATTGYGLLFDHLVGAANQYIRKCQPTRFARLQIDHRSISGDGLKIYKIYSSQITARPIQTGDEPKRNPITSGCEDKGMVVVAALAARAAGGALANITSGRDAISSPARVAKRFEVAVRPPLLDCDVRAQPRCCLATRSTAWPAAAHARPLAKPSRRHPNHR
jgi:hypothetical protein